MKRFLENIWIGFMAGSLIAGSLLLFLLAVACYAAVIGGFIGVVLCVAKIVFGWLST